MKLSRFLVEQQTWTELPQSDQNRFANYSDVQIVKYFRNQNPPKRVRRNSRGKWETIDASAAPSPSQTPTEQTVSFTKFVGDYEGPALLPNFSIIETGGKLYFTIRGGQTEITNVSGNNFKGFINGVSYDLIFTETNGVVTGGTAKVGPVSVNFTKKTNTPSPTPTDSGMTLPDLPDLSNIEWREMAIETWQVLKKAGYWVKEQGGKLLAAIQNGSFIKKVDNSAWDCINKWNEGWGYFKLLTGYEGDRKFLFEYTSHKVDGKKVKLLYFEDGEMLMKFTDTNQNVAGGKGKWSCTDSGYKIVWQNGQVAVFGNSKSLPDTTQNGDLNTTNSETTTSETPKFKEVCKAILPCPKRADVESGKASYKICMRCPEIAELQSNPVFKVIYFKKLKDRGFKESADGVFGPITKLAVEEYQEMNGLVKDGLIGQKTLAQLDKDKSGRK